MGVDNGSFVEIGARPGAASGWTLAASSPTTPIASFGDPAYGYDDFDWHAAVIPAYALAFFGSPGRAFEDFERGWLGGATGYYLTIPSGLADDATFASTGTHDDFAWGGALKLTWADVGDAFVVATDTDFDVAGYTLTWAGLGGSVEAAMFTADPDVAYDDFSDWTPIDP